CHYAELEDRGYPSKISHVICLGTPHLGAPLEKAANVASWPLARLPETRPFADLFITGRSAGIKDLRFGSCLEEDWCGCDPDEFLRDRCCECPFLESATYCFVAATLSAGPSGAGGLMRALRVTYRSPSSESRPARIPTRTWSGAWPTRRRGCARPSDAWRPLSPTASMEPSPRSACRGTRSSSTSGSACVRRRLRSSQFAESGERRYARYKKPLIAPRRHPPRRRPRTRLPRRS